MKIFRFCPLLAAFKLGLLTTARWRTTKSKHSHTHTHTHSRSLSSKEVLISRRFFWCKRLWQQFTRGRSDGRGGGDGRGWGNRGGWISWWMTVPTHVFCWGRNTALVLLFVVLSPFFSCYILQGAVLFYLFLALCENHGKTVKNRKNTRVNEWHVKRATYLLIHSLWATACSTLFSSPTHPLHTDAMKQCCKIPK